MGEGTPLDGRIRDSLDRVTSALPGGEHRAGQLEMALAVGRAIGRREPLVVQAGTGTGKSLAYLVPAVMSGAKVVVATATKALQDQLAGKDLPFLASHLDRPFSFAVLKGRANYACVQRLHEATTSDLQLTLDGTSDRSLVEEVRRLADWAATSPSGDRAELDHEPSARAWSAVSVGPRECPGAAKCPRSGDCFAERARAAAADAEVVIVNSHLYALDLESGGALLPEHDVVIVDEAHAFEDVVSATFGLELSAGRFTNLARVSQAILADPALMSEIERAARRVGDALADEVGRRLRGALEPDLVDALNLGRMCADRVLAAVRAVPDDGPGDVGARKQRAMRVAGALVDDIDWTLSPPPTYVLWVEAAPAGAVLRVAPLDVAEALSESPWSKTTVVLTSATIAPGLGARLGLPADDGDQIDVGSPFDYPNHALLYCAAHLPDPRSATYEALMHDELAALIEAAGGRTLALFTSHRALQAATEALRPRLGFDLLAQTDLPKRTLVERFAAEHATCLFATMGFWQGIDVPGPSLSLVTIDRLPFPRPDEPLLQARRERARAEAFRQVDLPRAATMLAQGAGRLIRTATDRGVVAVLDPRLATNTRYRWDIVAALPPMRRTRDRDEVTAFLRDVAEPVGVAKPR